jgi:hypothetical protein
MKESELVPFTAPMSAQPTETQFQVSPSRRWETRAMVGILIVSLLVQGNALLHHGYMGQDYAQHSNSILHAMQTPYWWLFEASNPPLLYWLGAFIHHVTLSANYEAVLSLIVVILNLFALYAWFRLSQSMIRSPLIRIGALLTLAFLPFRLIHSEVLASDGLAVLPFSLVIFLFVRMLRARNPRRQLVLAALLSATLILGLLAKYTMFSAVAVALLLLVFFRRSFASRATWVVALFFIVAIPATLARSEYRHYRDSSTDKYWKQTWGHDMQWRSLVFFKEADREILHAPSYDETILVDGKPVFNLSINNKHSYPALLHLSMYTDVLNIFQYDETDWYFGARSAENQSRMALTVKSAVLLSALTVVAVVACLLRILFFLWRDRAELACRPLCDQAIVLGFSLAFFANIACLLPTIAYVYEAGYWLARLVMPALLGFIFIGFVLLDDYVKSRQVHLLVLAYAVGQSALHLSFLWPRGP